MSTIKVNTITKRTGSTLTIGEAGTTVAIASGATTSGMGRTGTVDWDTTPKTSTVTAATGVGYFVNTSGGAITVNLPAGSAGAIVGISDYASTSQTNNITVDANGSEKINGDTGPYTIDTKGLAVTLVYVDSTKGWKSVTGSDEDATGVTSTPITATGGTITTVCTNYKVHTFTSPGTFQVTGGSGTCLVVDYTVVAGGGGGGIGSGGGYCGGGGGAGGFRESKVVSTSGSWTASPLAATSSVPVSIASFPIVVGAGGAGRSGCNGCSIGPNVTAGADGSNSSAFPIVSTGGGGGGGGSRTAPSNARTGGSGGGGGSGSPYPGAPAGLGAAGNTPPVSPAQGTNGGNGPGTASNSGGGGGGATAVGGNRSDPSVGGTGGAGATNTINGSPVARAGGGGGSSLGPSGADGGTGGGGNGARNTPASNATVGSANTGGGGGGGVRYSTGVGAAGGSGVVIIRYKFQ